MPRSEDCLKVCRTNAAKEEYCGVYKLGEKKDYINIEIMYSLAGWLTDWRDWRSLSGEVRKVIILNKCGVLILWFIGEKVVET